jgi:tRNA pseudouridine38-40 synthase
MLVAYDGTRFKGFAAQPGQRTVAGELAAAIGRVVQHPVEITCAGRTDRGVHAWGQVIHVDVQPPEGGIDVDGLARSCRKQLGPEIVVRAAALAEDGFDARRSATRRRYRYTILNRPVPDPFAARFAWHVEAPLDVRAMELACDPFYGEHDFSSFCRRPAPEATLVRNVQEARWRQLGDGVLRFEIAANAFCHQMVRSVVGTIVDVGLGRKRAGDLSAILRACDRAQAGQPAPARGLCLWEVSYGDDITWL